MSIYDITETEGSAEQQTERERERSRDFFWCHYCLVGGISFLSAVYFSFSFKGSRADREREDCQWVRFYCYLLQDRVACKRDGTHRAWHSSEHFVETLHARRNTLHVRIIPCRGGATLFAKAMLSRFAFFFDPIYACQEYKVRTRLDK